MPRKIIRSLLAISLRSFLAPGAPPTSLPLSFLTNLYTCHCPKPIQTFKVMFHFKLHYSSSRKKSSSNTAPHFRETFCTPHTALNIPILSNKNLQHSFKPPIHKPGSGVPLPLTTLQLFNHSVCRLVKVIEYLALTTGCCRGCGYPVQRKTRNSRLYFVSLQSLTKPPSKWERQRIPFSTTAHEPNSHLITLPLIASSVLIASSLTTA